MAMVAKTRPKSSVIPQADWLPDRLFKQMQASMPIACVDLAIIRKRVTYELLLIKRKIYPEAGQWCLVGGRILKNESTIQAIARQAARELGIAVKVMRPWSETHPFRVDNCPTADKQKHYISLLYPVRISSGRPRLAGPEFDDCRWFPLSALPERMGFIHLDQARAVAEALKFL